MLDVGARRVVSAEPVPFARVEGALEHRDRALNPRLERGVARLQRLSEAGVFADLEALLPKRCPGDERKRNDAYDPVGGAGLGTHHEKTQGGKSAEQQRRRQGLRGARLPELRASRFTLAAV